MNIIEQNVTAKSPARKSEDGIVVTDHFIAVIDGSTSKSEFRHSIFRSNGRQAMRLAGSFIKKAPKDIDCHHFLLGVTALFRKQYATKIHPQMIAHPEDRLTCSAIVFSRLRREIWMIGDCQCLIDGHLCTNPKPTEETIAEKRAKRARQLMDEGATLEELLEHDRSRDAIVHDIVEGMKQQNVTYAVIDGFPIPERQVPVIALDFQPHEIVLASDGYPLLANTLEESERLLDNQRQQDPLNIGTFKATKAFMNGQNSFDDRSYIRFRV